MRVLISCVTFELDNDDRCCIEYTTGRSDLQERKARMAWRPEFGEFCRDKRLDKEMTLREFCREHEFDPAWISRIERGLLTPPKSKRLRSKLAGALGLKESSEDWYEFHDLADLCAGRLPDSVSDNERIVSLLPVFFRAIGKTDMNETELRQLVEALKRELP